MKIATGGLDKTVKIWNFSSKKCLRTYSNLSKSAYSIDLSMNNGTIAYSNEENILKVLNMQTEKELSMTQISDEEELKSL